MKLTQRSPGWALVIGLFQVTLFSTCSANKDLKQSLQPYITDTETDVTVNKGKTAKIKCTVENQGTKTVVWKRVDEPNPLTIGTFAYVPDSRISAIHNKYKNIWTLQIRRVELSDAGDYECQVSSKDHIYKHFRLIVTDLDEEEEVLPRVVLKGKKYVDIGQPIELVCNATGEDEPPQDLDWFKDGDKINAVAGSDIEIVKYKSQVHRAIVSKLLIPKARKSDKGDYVCRVGIEDDDTASFALSILNELSGEDMSKAGDNSLCQNSREVQGLSSSVPHHSAATNNVKRGTEKDVDKKSNAEKKTGKERKEGRITYETRNGNGASVLSVSMASHPVYLITLLFVLLHLFQYTLQERAHATLDTP